MRIAYILPQFPVRSETFAVSDVNALARLGHAVSVFSLRPLNAETAGLLSRTKLEPAVRVEHGSVGDLVQFPRRAVRYGRLVSWALGQAAAIAGSYPQLAASIPPLLPRLLAIVDEVMTGSYDVVHAFWGRHPSLVLGALHALGGTRPRLSVFVGAYDLVRDDAFVDLGLKLADIRFTHTRSNEDYFRSKGYFDVEVVHRGIPIDDFAAIGADAPRANEVLTASTLNKRKNVEAVIRTFALVAAEWPEVTLAIAGSGPDQQRLADIAADLGLAGRVIFLGYIPREELFRRMCRASVFLFLSLKDSERLPNVIKEALLAGCNVVTSESPGIRELVEEPALGRIVPGHDLDAAARALRAALGESRDSAVNRRRQAAQWITAHWSSQTQMAKYICKWEALGARR
jgi:glycosyltransferase involved in cell wall biosynthesis